VWGRISKEIDGGNRRDPTETEGGILTSKGDAVKLSSEL
jgi:hypothetical protein